MPASEAGLRAQYPAVAPGENGATPGTRAGEIELARNQTAAYPEPVVQDRAEHDLQKTQDDRIAERRLDGVPSLGLRLGGMIVGSCRTRGPEYDMPLLNNRDTHGDPHFGGDYLVEFSTFNDAGAVPVFYSIAVLDEDREMGEEGLLVRAAPNCYLKKGLERKINEYQPKPLGSQCCSWRDSGVSHIAQFSGFSAARGAATGILR